MVLNLPCSFCLIMGMLTDICSVGASAVVIVNRPLIIVSKIANHILPFLLLSIHDMYRFFGFMNAKIEFI